MERQARESLTDIIRQAYSQPARGWHNMAHLRRMAVALDFPPGTDKDYALTMKTAMYWHDFVYEPGQRDNEAKSEEAMRMVLKPTTVTEEAARLVQATVNPEKRDISHRWVRGDEPVAIESFGGMLVDYLHTLSTEVGGQVTLVRGLRDGYDLMQEFQFNQVLQDQAKHRGYPPVPIFYIRGDVEHQHVSSSVVRALPEQERDLYLPRKWDWRAALKAFVDVFGQQEPEELDIFKEQ